MSDMEHCTYNHFPRELFSIAKLVWCWFRVHFIVAQQRYVVGNCAWTSSTNSHSKRDSTNCLTQYAWDKSIVQILANGKLCKIRRTQTLTFIPLQLQISMWAILDWIMNDSGTSVNGMSDRFKQLKCNLITVNSFHIDRQHRWVVRTLTQLSAAIQEDWRRRSCVEERAEPRVRRDVPDQLDPAALHASLRSAQARLQRSPLHLRRRARRLDVRA